MIAQHASRQNPGTTRKILQWLENSTEIKGALSDKYVMGLKAVWFSIDAAY